MTHRFEPLRDAQGQPVVRPPKKGEWFMTKPFFGQPIPVHCTADFPSEPDAERAILRRIEEPDEPQADAINPAYYKGDVECIDAIAEATRHLTGIEAVCTGNIIRYAWRWKEKGGADDLRKLIWYAERLLGPAGCRAAVEARGE